MIYRDAQDWRETPNKAVALLGMSGVGKTRIASLLRDQGDWFHYSVDYRIGTRYLGEAIVDNFKREVMKNPFLSDLLRSDSIYIASNLSFHNLSPLSTWLGKPGDPAKGGIPFEEYVSRQRQHREAEIASMLDARAFIERGQDLYRYRNFICDTSGSVCEVVDPADGEDRVMTVTSRAMLPIYIRETEAHRADLTARFDRAPKPMYYQEAFLRTCWGDYLAARNLAEDQVDPDDFIRWGFGRLLDHRAPRYQAVADRWGLTVEADDIAAVQTEAEFDDLVARALDRRAAA